MRGILASSIGVTCAAALALPLAPPATAAAARGAPTAEAATRASVPAAEPSVPGSTQSLPLNPLSQDRTSGAAVFGLAPRTVRHFSLLGVIWDDPAAELHGRVQVRTRATGTGTWSGWQDVETHNADHAADPGTAERSSGRVRGATAPLWVGESDGVEIRVQAEPEPSGADSGTAPGTASGTASGEARTGEAAGALPAGLHLELIDPGADPAPAEAPAAAAPPPGTAADESRTGVMTAEETAVSEANAGLAPLGATEIPALTRAQTEAELLALRGTEAAGAVDAAGTGGQQQAKPYIGPRPAITTRRGWGANEGLRKGGFVYTKKVKAAFVHHTASGNNYSCAQAPSLIRGFYRYHVVSLGWRDIGYNFLIDKCGRIYEGRAGGVAQPVMGAHTLGFNSNSMGVAVIGSYGSKKPSSSAVKAVSRLTAWKLGLHGMNPKSKTYLTSAGGNLYGKGKKVRLNVISGHRDGFNTSCPGGKLYGKLGKARSTAARYQGR
ncbi:peptidoglycan recognition protein [Streptomyces sp. NPDC052012]|uniref:peptidoglycan recognition protein family protein n=1 Tax=Streptomyces sp. NPDC052012 TaxID=3155051 RepID=UPI00344D92BD